MLSSLRIFFIASYLPTRLVLFGTDIVDLIMAPKFTIPRLRDSRPSLLTVFLLVQGSRLVLGAVMVGLLCWTTDMTNVSC